MLCELADWLEGCKPDQVLHKWLSSVFAVTIAAGKRGSQGAPLARSKETAPNLEAAERASGWPAGRKLPVGLGVSTGRWQMQSARERASIWPDEFVANFGR